MNARFDRMTLSLLYGRYDAQPLLGFLEQREGLLGSTLVKINSNWTAIAALRYDIHANKISQTQFGIGYIDDCLILALNYVTNYSYNVATSVGVTTTNDQRIVMQLTLRTLGGTGVGYTLNSSPIPQQ